MRASVRSYFAGWRFNRRESGAVIVLSLAIALVALSADAALRYAFDDTFAPLYGGGYRFDQPIQEDGPFAPGQVVTALSTKCSHSSVSVIVETQWRRELPSVAIVPAYHTGRVREEGCETKAFEYAIPLDLPEGTWRLVGLERAISGSNESQDISWQTETFVVVKP